MIHNKYVDEYIQQWRDGKIVFNQERIDLIEYLEKDVLTPVSYTHLTLPTKRIV